jgi:hypothetical protein
MSLKIWLRHADPSERLDPKLREAVELGLHRILPFRRDRFGDDTLAIDAIESVVCAASKTPGSIRNPRSYIISSALRRLKRFLRQSPVIRYFPPDHLEALASTNPYNELDARLFSEQVRALIGDKEYAFLMSVLMKECTWEQLGAQIGLSGDAARKKYDRLITNLRERLSQNRPSERK